MSTESKKSATITVGKISIAVDVDELPIESLRYYASNPRIFSILKHLGTDVSQDVIERELWNLGSTKDLYRDILKNGGLVEEILVRNREVLEGNSRLCAYRHLLNKAKNNGDQDAIAKWSRIRAKILPPDVNEETVFAILGILHIRGKAKWLPYEQASYLYRQSVDFRKTYRELAHQIGVSEGDVKSSIEAYRMMEEYKITELSRFSFYLTYVTSRKMKEAAESLLPGQEIAPLFVGWVENGDIPNAENVRDLPLILKDNKARKKFLEGRASFEDALEIARDRHPDITSSFYSKLKRATETLNNAPVLRVKEDIQTDKNKKYILTNLRKAVNRLCKAVGLEAEPAGGKKRRGNG